MQTGLEEYNYYDNDERVARPAQSSHQKSVKKKMLQTHSSEDTRVEGAVRNLRLDRGFGFIAGDDGVDYFLHWSGMEKTTKDFRELELLDRVSFIPIQGPKGPKAIQVRVLDVG